MNDTLTSNTNGASGPIPVDRAAVNRANAQHSTGPRTESGKQRSSLNALRHGLTGHTIVMPAEDLAAYERHTKRLSDDLRPKGALEEQLVQTLIDTAWRLNRIPALENNLLTLGMTQHSSSINTQHPEAHAALAMADALRDQTQALASLSMHEQRLSRQFERTLQQLRAIQATRRLTDHDEMYKAAQLFEMSKEKGLRYEPAQDGFVFSIDEIEAHIQRRDRHSAALRHHQAHGN